MSSILRVRDSNGNVIDVLAIKGKDGKDGKDYILTESDKQEIAEIVQANIPSAEEVDY